MTPAGERSSFCSWFRRSQPTEGRLHGSGSRMQQLKVGGWGEAALLRAARGGGGLLEDATSGEPQWPPPHAPPAHKSQPSVQDGLPGPSPHSPVSSPRNIPASARLSFKPPSEACLTRG
ncbi:hypothetical protein H1C71_014963 [Ictidomys tridecemlineatus]|nr:hypothetical protein H1C71_014963 [Ictidomys tridecemlineatus]